MKVFVYKNLHKGCFSVKAMEGSMKGRVIAHVDSIKLTDCQLKVSQAGRARVLRTRQKNVHAGVRGEWSMKKESTQLTDKMTKVRYNPYEVSTFVEAATGNPVLAAKEVFIDSNGVFVNF
jgi:hypothetical protein